MVRAIEACGSRSGDTAFDVMIADCGQLNSGTASGASASAASVPRGVRGYASAVRGAASMPAWVQSRETFAGAAVLRQGVRCVCVAL